MAKDKKSKKDKQSGKKDAKNAKSTTAEPIAKLKSIAQHPLVADVVAAALVATASALKDPQRARALASEAADELTKLSKAGAERGNALWEMALEIGKRSLESFSTQSKQGNASPKSSGKKAKKAVSKKTAKDKSTTAAKQR